MKYLILILILLLSGCIQHVSDPQATLPQEPTGYVGSVMGTDVGTVHDDKNEVTCWVSDGYYSGGVYCIPDWMLKKPANVQ